MTRTRYANSGGVRIAYQQRTRLLGRRRPWLVLVQGLGFDRSGWDPVVGGLGRRFRLLLLDNRGIGDSDAPPGPYTVAQLAHDVTVVLDTAGIDAAHFAGASLGGMIVQEFAIRHPQRVRRLVLVGTTPGWPLGYPLPEPTARLLVGNRYRSAEQTMRRYVENALAPTAIARQPELVDRLVAHQRAHLPDPSGWRAQAAAGAGWAGYGRQANIHAETLVLQGTADRVVDPRNARLLADRIPNAQLELLPDTGHLLFWEVPRRFVDIVTAFLHERRPHPVPAAAG
jgi:3-oxoadipate enol-lactonase